MMRTNAASLPLAYEDHGSGLPVLLLHGLTFDRTNWRPIVQRLDGEVRTIAVDLPAHGESGGSAIPLHEVAARVHDLARELGAERPVIVGHSMSGAIASIYAATFPTLGAVSVDQSADVRPHSRAMHELWPALNGPGFASAFDAFERSMGLEKVRQPLRSEILASQRILPEVVLGYSAELVDVEPDEMQAQIENEMMRITCPYLAVFGRPLPSGEARYMLDRLKRLQITEWPDGGHFVHLVDPDRFTERLRSFIEFCAQSETVPAAARPQTVRSGRVNA
jgi:pimeloyl-ACP methyl ester carboxylesterase